MNKPLVETAKKDKLNSPQYQSHSRTKSVYNNEVPSTSQQNGVSKMSYSSSKSPAQINARRDPFKLGSMYSSANKKFNQTNKNSYIEVKPHDKVSVKSFNNKQEIQSNIAH
jgi:hypothetical protein